jgi:hypothetical protein
MEQPVVHDFACPLEHMVIEITGLKNFLLTESLSNSVIAANLLP